MVTWNSIFLVEIGWTSWKVKTFPKLIKFPFVIFIRSVLIVIQYLSIANNLRQDGIRNWFRSIWNHWVGIFMHDLFPSPSSSSTGCCVDCDAKAQVFVCQLSNSKKKEISSRQVLQLLNPNSISFSTFLIHNYPRESLGTLMCRVFMHGENWNRQKKNVSLPVAIRDFESLHRHPTTIRLHRCHDLWLLSYDCGW